MTGAHDEALRAVRSLASQDELRENFTKPNSPYMACDPELDGEIIVTDSHQVAIATFWKNPNDTPERVAGNVQSFIEAEHVFRETGLTPWQLAGHAQHWQKIAKQRIQDVVSAWEERDRLKQDVAELVEALDDLECEASAEIDPNTSLNLAILRARKLLQKHKPAEDARRGA